MLYAFQNVLLTNDSTDNYTEDYNDEEDSKSVESDDNDGDDDDDQPLGYQ